VIRRTVTTVGEVVEVETAARWVSDLLAESLGGADDAEASGRSALRIRVEDAPRPFAGNGWTFLTRGALVGDHALLVRDVCTSGFDALLEWHDHEAQFTFRWNPPPRTRAANLALRSRFHLLARAALLQYPALWWAGTRGRVPLHAPSYARRRVTPLLAGPSGVGKTTLLARELADGASAVSDNLCVGDGERVWGLVEPMRADHLAGRRMPHGRREGDLPNRVAVLTPDRVVVLRRGDGRRVEVRPLDAEVAARVLSTGTYMAGELRRYWSFAATLALASGLGPAHPPVVEVAQAFANRLPCLEVALPKAEGHRSSDVLAGPRSPNHSHAEPVFRPHQEVL
jgi:hypothetical protein